MFSDYNGIKLEINHRKITSKYLYLNSTFLNNAMVKDEVAGTVKNILS